MSPLKPPRKCCMFQQSHQLLNQSSLSKSGSDNFWPLSVCQFETVQGQNRFLLMNK